MRGIKPEDLENIFRVPNPLTSVKPLVFAAMLLPIMLIGLEKPVVRAKGINHP